MEAGQEGTQVTLGFLGVRQTSLDEERAKRLGQRQCIGQEPNGLLLGRGRLFPQWDERQQHRFGGGRGFRSSQECRERSHLDLPGSLLGLFVFRGSGGIV